MSRPNYRNSFKNHHSKFGNMQTIEINAEALEGLVEHTLSSHVGEGNAVFKGLQGHVQQLANHSRCQDHKLCNFQQQKQCQHCSNTRLNEIALALGTIIQSTPSLPAHVTAETHSKIGLLRQKQGNSKGSIQSFLKALWIQSSLPAPSANSTERNDLLWKIAMTKHRLGLAFGRNNNFSDAVRLLQNAVQDYQVHVHDSRYDNKLMEQAGTALHNTMEAQTLHSVLASQKAPSAPRFGRSNTIAVPIRRTKSVERSSSNLYSNTPRRASFATMA